jgi:hypothetical protein
MSRHLFQLGQLSPCNAAFLDPFSRSESAVYSAEHVAESTDGHPLSVHSLRGDLFLELGAESSRVASYAGYDGHEVLAMSWMRLWARQPLLSGTVRY